MRLVHTIITTLAITISGAVFADCPVSMPHNQLMDCIILEASENENPFAGEISIFEANTHVFADCPVSLPYNQLVDCIIFEASENENPFAEEFSVFEANTEKTMQEDLETAKSAN